eukprot:CAMPEP_0171622398 /NCGR_PEP_ID=MMETSP0990-20121206/17217_1 /TAXON_ID=483369 /ORGANISM="non described non described, Strain CCMP2098" /LENGTH=76 /DNA_ID=CAMNT_0012188183 /DNA_START=99 /DNA_END=329 /DNA_ORIENTATION=+
MSHRDTADALEALFEVSNLLNTGLNRNSLSILVQLCELGVNPGALVHVVQELRRESGRLAQQEDDARSLASFGQLS